MRTRKLGRCRPVRPSQSALVAADQLGHLSRGATSVQHTNTSGFEALLYPAFNREGRETAIVIVRATFELNQAGHLQPADEQVPVRLEDVYFGDPGESSSLEESDLAIYKPGTDVVVVGDAHAPGGQP